MYVSHTEIFLTSRIRRAYTLVYCDKIVSIEPDLNTGFISNDHIQGCALSSASMAYKIKFWLLRISFIQNFHYVLLVLTYFDRL